MKTLTKPGKVLSIMSALAIAFATPCASAAIVQFDILDHPDGAAAVDGLYGLRLDDPSTSATNTFHFVDVVALFDTDANTISIAGSVVHNQTSNGYDLDAFITLDTPIDVAQLLSPTSSFDRLTGHTQSLSITGPGGFGPTNWMGFAMTDTPDQDNFRLDTNHRGVGPNLISGWGWLAPIDDYPNGHQNYQDWLFTMTGGEVVPEPATMTLMGLGAAALAYRQRRRSGKA